MRIGIYLAYPPAKNLSFKQEGLGRLLAYLVKAMEKNGHQIVLATSTWSIEALQELFESYGIDSCNIEVLLSDYQPQLLKIYMKYIGFKRPKRKNRLKKAAVAWIDKWMERIFKIKHFVTLFIFMLAATALMIILAPIVLMVGSCYWLIYIVIKIFQKREIRAGMKESLKNNSIVAGVLRHISVKYLQENVVLQYFRDDMAEDLLRKIKYMRNPVDIWYSPMAFWPEFHRISGKKVVCVPDLVVSDFASNYSGMFSSIHNMRNIRNTIKQGEYFITYCEYVKESLLVRQFGKKRDQIAAVPHAVNNMMDEIMLSQQYDHEEIRNNIFKRHARNILKTISAHSVNQSVYLGQGCYEFAFRDVEYIFYASQLRGSKNVLNLIRAYHKVLRKKHMQIKLFLTCAFDEDSEIGRYIAENCLQYDVLSFWRVSKQQLAALYTCARLVVNPTFYEGGFPFTFGEGMSVGTPSVMSKIPQVTDVMNGYSLDHYMFDPYNVEDMAEKIEYALNHTEELYEAEKPLYEEMNKRSWYDVGEEYVKVFEAFKNRQ